MDQVSDTAMVDWAMLLARGLRHKPHSRLILSQCPQFVISNPLVINNVCIVVFIRWGQFSNITSILHPV